MTTLRVHFDGKVLVPEGPVDLPRNTSLEIQIAEIPARPVKGEFIFGEENGFPTIQPPPGSRIITSEDVQAAMEDDF